MNTPSFFLLILLAGCAHGQGLPVCGTIKPWTGDQQAQMLYDMDTFVPKDSPLIGAMQDYHTMRNEARACRKENGG